MPYFVYVITPARQFTLLETFDKYKPAKVDVTERREQQQEGDTDIYRMVFARDKQEARRLATTARGIASPLEEWEEKL